MSSMHVILVSCITLLAISCSTNVSEKKERLYVLLISLDGFRYDYAKKFNAKNILSLQKKASFAKGFRPPYPSKTFPSHYSMITGLYPGEHGIVANHFFNKKLNKEYKLKDREAVKNHKFYKGAPIWNVLEENKILTAPVFWPGSEAKINGAYPTYVETFVHERPNNIRIDKVISLLKLEKSKRPHFLTLYISDIDSVGHQYGTNSKELKKAIKKVDAELGTLFSKINKLKIPINIVLVSDHGMQNIKKKDIEYIDDYVSLKGVKYLGDCPHGLIYTRNNIERDRIFKLLKLKAKHFKVYKRDEIPKHYNYNRPPVGELLIDTDLSYCATTREEGLKSIATHGYNPYNTNFMNGIFYAFGPNIKKKNIGVVDSVNLYSFILKIFKIDAKNRRNSLDHLVVR